MTAHQYITGTKDKKLQFVDNRTRKSGQTTTSLGNTLINILLFKYIK